MVASSASRRGRVREWGFREALISVENRGTARKLGFYTLLMAVLPVSAYYAASNSSLLFGDWADRERYLFSGLIAVIVTNLIMAAYALEALREDDSKGERDPHTGKSD